MNNNMNNKINYLIEYVYKNTENIKHLNININLSDITHFVEFNDNYKFDIIDDVINKLIFKNIHFIIKKKESVKVRNFIPKDNFDRIICNCTNSCICDEKYFREVIEDRLIYTFSNIKPNDYVYRENEDIHGLSFNLF
jgi:predicted DNA binding CopG/RHH family protein